MRNTIIAIIFIASVCFFLPAYAVKPVSGFEDAISAVLEMRRDVLGEMIETLSGARRLKGIKIVDRFGITKFINPQDLEAEIASKSVGGGSIDLAPKDVSRAERISTRMYWQSQLAKEAILELTSHGAVTVYLLDPSHSGSLYDVDWSYSDYRMDRIKIQLNEHPAVLLSEFVKGYQQRQELELGRYFGPAANVRKLAKRLAGLPTATCPGLFFTAN